jgi:DNA helicase-4
MDPLWLVLGLVVVAILAIMVYVTLPVYRKRCIEQSRASLDDVRKTLSRIDNSFEPYSSSKEYLPERIGRPLTSEIQTFVLLTLPSLEKSVRRTHDSEMKKEFEAITIAANQLRQNVKGHNYQYVQRAINDHTKLLVQELKLDPAQREATVRDDERNLVLAAAGSGKTRTIIARIRYLLELGVAPTSILAITFTKEATEEMESRLKEMRVPIASQRTDGVTVSTLHALGNRIVQAATLGPTSIADKGWTETLVANALRDAREARDQQLAKLYYNAILNFHRDLDERTPALGADPTHRTFQGEHVRSIGERIIADFLLTHQVSYKYEENASWAQVGQGRSAYHPDFTLPDYGACIEYWGIDRQGNVPLKWANSSAEYNEGISWKRGEFRRTGKRLIEFYDYERKEGTLELALETRLTSAGVRLGSVTLTELEKILGNTKYIGSVIERQLVRFIGNARSFRMSTEQIFERLKSATPRVYHFGILGAAVLQRYERELASEGRIDFADMLHRAPDLMQKHPSALPKFDHILVDEFQDISAAMARLVNSLVGASQAHLFVVGDDWQAIYGFGGGDVDHVVNFESHFGPATHTMLDTNYRSPATIVEAGAALIAHNPGQIPKQVLVSTPERGEAFIHEVPDDDSAIVNKAIQLVQEELKRVDPDEILVLSRTNHLIDGISKGCRLSGIPVADEYQDTLGVRILTAHKAKGLEASVVVIANASDDLFGFPSKMENSDVLEPVRMSAANGPAEERRLFYVAVTRARKRLHLISRQGHPSPYIAEIEGASQQSQTASRGSFRPGVRFNDAFYVEQVYRLTDRQAKAHIRQCGLMTTLNGRFSFTSYLPFYLDQGRSYSLTGVLYDRPYQNRHQVKLDRATRVERQAIQPQSSLPKGVRQLCPRPPPSFQPRLLVPNNPLVKTENSETHRQERNLSP